MEVTSWRTDREQTESSRVEAQLCGILDLLDIRLDARKMLERCYKDAIKML